MKRLFIATSNSGKTRELQQQLKGRFEVLTPKSPAFSSQPIPDVKEDGETYYENALKKAMAFYAAYQLPVLADDSGLEVAVIGGQPGVHSAYLGGVGISWAERWEALYRLLRPFPSSEWKACFRSILCYYDGQSVPVFFEGSTQGLILPAPRGGEGFGYDPIFFSPELHKTFGEATPEEKASVNHRIRALQRFLAWSLLDRQ